MSPIPDISPDTDIDVKDSCNCWSSCCGSRQQKQVEKDKALEEKIQKIVAQELAKK